jgi:hypothetical protein
MIYINKISYIGIKTVRIQIYSLYLNFVPFMQHAG